MKIIVDDSKCISCGLCADICPIGLIFIRKKTNKPVSFRGSENFCIKCGHCVAICPKSVFSTPFMDTENCEKIDYSTIPSFKQIEIFLKSRRSIRKFKSEKVPNETIKSIIATTDYAPAGHNLKLLNWLIIQQESKLIECKENIVEWMRETITSNPDFSKMLHLQNVVAAYEKNDDRILRSAPQIAVVYSEADNNIATMNANIALTYFELLLYSNNIGACWAGYFHLASMYSSKFLKSLNLPNNAKCCGAMLFGYSEHKFVKIPLRKESNITFC